jgi:propanediol utilization protein
VDREEIRKIVEKVLEKKSYGRAAEQDPGHQRTGGPDIPVEASARHVHLTQAALETLFGSGAGLTEKRALSQPGEFLSDQRVRLIGPKGDIGSVAILGPLRKAVQAEISLSDARVLGVEAPLRLSGDLSGAADLYIVGPAGILHAKGAAIIAKNHLHLRPRDAEALRVSDGGRVRVRVNTGRPLVFEDVSVRVRDTFMPAMHIDFDEANACMLGNGGKAEILGEASASSPEAVSQRAVPHQATPSHAKPGSELAPSGEPVPPGEAAPRSGGVPVPPGPRKNLVTEAEAKRLVSRSSGAISLARGTIITPAAKDVFSYAGCSVEFV